MTSARIPPQVPIAVVGIAAFMPGSTDLGGFWRNVLTGRDLMTDVPASRWLIDDYYDPDPRATDKTYGRRGAFLPEVDFDPVHYGIPPNSLPAIDTSQLLALMVAERGASPTARSACRRTGSGSACCSAWRRCSCWSNRRPGSTGQSGSRRCASTACAEAQAQSICDSIAAEFTPWQEETFPGLLSNVVSGRIANKFDLHGANHTTDAACASSLAALYSAVADLSLQRSDLVITGGVDTSNDIPMYRCFTSTPALSPTGDCRPVLRRRRRHDARRGHRDVRAQADRGRRTRRRPRVRRDPRRRRILRRPRHGHLRAAARGPGARAAASVRVGRLRPGDGGAGRGAWHGHQRWRRRRVHRAGRGLRRAGRPDRPWCALGSVKSQIGHTKAAAGAAGMLKAVLALQQKVLPPTIKVEPAQPGARPGGQPLLPEHRDAAVGAACGRGRPPAPRVGVELRVRRHQLSRRARGVRAASGLVSHPGAAPARRPDRADSHQRAGAGRPARPGPAA